jgi:hypothetical protein
MLKPEWIGLETVTALLNLMASVIICRYLVQALQLLPNIKASQFRTSKGVLSGFDFILAGTLLKSIGVKQWQPLLMLIAILLIRTMLKKSFTWEKTQLSKEYPD